MRFSLNDDQRQVMDALESVFQVPVIEAYGMTEASHQMASNPLPPHPRFSGCVGIAAGPDIGIMDEKGVLLEPGGLGEIVIRGPNVTGEISSASASTTSSRPSAASRSSRSNSMARGSTSTATTRAAPSSSSS